MNCLRARWSICLVAAQLLLLGSCGPQAEDEANSAQASVTVDLPAAQLPENGPAPLQENAQATAVEAPAEPSVPIAEAPSEEAGADKSNTGSNATEEQSAPEQTPEPAEPDPQTSTTGGLPLPNSVVARTIDRIGFQCGRVLSVAAVAGAAPGTYKVTCSSGLSYQASPRNGRYRFRKWSG